MIRGYRVWDNQEKTYSDKAFSIDQFGLCYVQDEDGYWEEINDSRFIVEFETGLTDKNDKEINEGDIIDYNSDGQAIGYVKYNAPHYELIDKAGYTMFLKGSPHQTIIGNIHENQELLGGKE